MRLASGCPFFAACTAARRRRAPNRTWSDAMGPHILVLDAAPDLRALYQDAFESEGYRVTLRDHVPTDLSEIEAVQPDVIVMDYLFNGHPVGWALLQSLKQRPATQTIPILMCTAATRTVQAQAVG
jgi:CheY-like chemotaxis protein